MSTFREAVQAMEPRLVRRENGGWLAVSQPGAPISIAVIGLDQDDARVRFRTEAVAWGVLLEERDS
jgi:hypothetical protein